MFYNHIIHTHTVTDHITASKPQTQMTPDNVADHRVSNPVTAKRVCYCAFYHSHQLLKGFFTQK